MHAYVYNIIINKKKLITNIQSFKYYPFNVFLYKPDYNLHKYITSVLIMI